MAHEVTIPRLVAAGKVALPAPANGEVAQEVGLDELAAPQEVPLQRLAAAEDVVLPGPAAGR